MVSTQPHMDPLLLWERFANAAPAGRIAAMLEEIGRDPGAVPLGQGIKHLAALRRLGVIEGYAVCPSCGAGNTVMLEPAMFDGFNVPQDMTPITVQSDGLVVEVRPLSAEDLAAAGRRHSPDAASEALRRAVFVAAHRRTPVEAVVFEDLPQAVWADVEAALEAADPLADPRLALSCQSCGHGWDLALDLPDLMMHELWQEARATLAETAALARAYGWSERDIAALSPARRRAYLELAQ